MTAIFNELRALEDRLGRGELTREEFARRRAEVLLAVEDAHTEFDAPAARAQRAKRGNTTSALGLSVALCFGVMALTTGATMLLLPDLNLALTVGVTILAALTVALLRHPDL